MRALKTVHSILTATLTLAFCIATVQQAKGQQDQAKIAAEQGSAEAQFNFWYQKAVTQGDVAAQRNVGIAYAHGLGVPVDYAKAVEWYKKAVLQGDAGAQYGLGRCYENGWGVAKDGLKAVELFQKAANQGYDDAALHLGCAYASGKGVPMDEVRAYAWFNVAAASGNADAAKFRDGASLTLEQVAEAQKLSAELFKNIHKK